MIDPVSAAMVAITTRSPAAFGLVFLAGVVTSIGPCVAPRYITIAALVNGDRRPRAATLAFVAGLIGAFMLLGYCAGLLGALWSWSMWLYMVLAIGLVVGGAATLMRAVPQQHVCGPNNTANARNRSFGAIFLLGAASAFIISPCCTPIVAAVVAMTTAMGKPLLGVALLGSFAIGHAAPLFFAGKVGSFLRHRIPGQQLGQAPAIVGSVLMLALGIYYGVLA